MKTFTAVALALLVGAGVGYGAFAVQNETNNENIPVSAVESAQAIAREAATIEPAAEEKSHGADDPVVAKVDGSPVYRTEVLEFMKSLPPQMQQADPKSIFPMAVDQVVSAKIVDAKAKSDNIDADPLVLKRLEDAKVQIVRAVYAEKAIEKDYTEEAVKKSYDDIVKNMPKVDEVHARHILVDSADKAKEIISKLEGGAKFEDLAKEFSKDKSNSGSGGDLGYFSQADMVKEFADAAFALKPNEYTKSPVKTQFGFHVVQSLDKRARPAPKYDDVKLQLEGQVKREILNKLVAKWRDSAAVEQFDYDGNPVVKTEEKKSDAPAVTPAPTAPAEEKKAE